MGLNRQEKAAKVEEVSALVAAAQTIVVAEYRGLDVESVTKLRRQARSQGVQLRVLKNTLARRAVSGTPFSGLSDKMVGPLVYGFSSDPVAAAKVLAGFAKDNDKLVVKAGAMPHYVMDEKGVKALATVFGGGIEGARGEGMHTFGRLMRDYVKRYPDVLKWLGVERSLLFPEELSSYLRAA